MKLKRLKKRCITLIEMMIVMFLIAMITGVIAYNYTGSLEEGKAFKTKNGIEKIKTIVDLHMATNASEDLSNIKTVIQNSPLVKNSDEPLKDGWGQPYRFDTDEKGDLIVISDKYNEYLNKGKGSLFKKDNQ